MRLTTEERKKQLLQAKDEFKRHIGAQLKVLQEIKDGVSNLGPYEEWCLISAITINENSIQCIDYELQFIDMHKNIYFYDEIENIYKNMVANGLFL